MSAQTHESPSRGGMPEGVEELVFGPSLLGLASAAVLGIALMAVTTMPGRDQGPTAIDIASLEDAARTTGSLGPQLRGMLDPE